MNLCWKEPICCLISRLSPRKSLLSLKLAAVEAVVRAEDLAAILAAERIGPMMRSFCPIIRQRIPGSTERKCRLNLRKSPVRRCRSAAVQREAGNKNHRPAKSKTDKKPDQKLEAEVERGPSEPEQETVIYQMERETARDRLFSLMLAGYGLIGLGAAALLYRHIKRKK